MTLRVKPEMIENFLTFDSIHWKALEQYFTAVLFVFKFYPLCNFGTFIKFGLVTIKCERLKKSVRIIKKKKEKGTEPFLLVVHKLTSF